MLKIIQITGLPFYEQCRYSEEELAKALKPFGFRYTPSAIFVLPQVQMVRTHPNLCLFKHVILRRH